jgi:uncharacterized protein (TIGR02145 family)
MNKKNRILLLISLLVASVIISCNKDENNDETSNNNPTCNIISPSNGEEIIKGTSVNISVDAEDSDGSINEVRYFIDEISVDSSDSFPYNFEWETAEESLGNHTIKATAIDNESGSASDEIIISIVTNVGPCPGMPAITDIDGNTYNTVQIGDQCWMKENLKTTTYNNGTSIPNVTGDNSWASLITGAYVWNENDITWKNSYGALYNWYSIVDPKGLCPSGWHVPTNVEWTALTDFIGGTGAPHGNELKSCRQENSPLGGECDTFDHPRWDQDNSDRGTDDYGFSGLPGGNRYYEGLFYTVGRNGNWWTSTESSSTKAFYRNLSRIYGYVGSSTFNKGSGKSVRCIRD